MNKFTQIYLRSFYFGVQNTQKKAGWKEFAGEAKNVSSQLTFNLINKLNHTKPETLAAIGGGIAGGTAGAIIDKKNRWRGGIIGGLAGGGLGYGIAKSLGPFDQKALKEKAEDHREVVPETKPIPPPPSTVPQSQPLPSSPLKESLFTERPDGSIEIKPGASNDDVIADFRSRLPDPIKEKNEILNRELDPETWERNEARIEGNYQIEKRNLEASVLKFMIKLRNQQYEEVKKKLEQLRTAS